LREADHFSYGEGDTVNEESLAWIDLNITDSDDVKTILQREDFQEVFKARAEMIQKQYTKLPTSVPDRVYQLAEEITANYDTTYDKLKAIESFLQEYRYTLEPGEIPADVDFADYFLFENQEGYCTSYATAMAVLGRCIGVPTRYIEGFIVKYDRRETEKMYPVMNSQAHAWAEAYIEGVGWIPFEATSSFNQERYLKWKDLPKQSETGSPVDTSMYHQEEIGNRIGLDQIGTAELEEDNASEEIVAGFIVFFAAVALLFLVFTVYYLVLRLQYRQEYERADNSQKMYLLFLRILSLLKWEGYELGQQETILMLAKRVKDEFHFDKVTFPIVADIYMQYRYAEAETTREQFLRVEVFQKGLASKRNAEQSKTWLLWEEFLFLTKNKNMGRK
ncbi:MAG: transglutaminase-like domain-containing protein, partial [Mobilitalea sp.]